VASVCLFTGTQSCGCAAKPDCTTTSGTRCTGTPRNSPYGISFTYGGDINFDGGTGSSSLKVVDTIAPTVSVPTATPGVLSPPNHQLVDIQVSYTATDASGAPVCALKVSSNEPVNGTGDGNTSSDWTILDSHHVQLRSERAGSGTGRIYTITATCSDSSGHSTSRGTTVTVPAAALLKTPEETMAVMVVGKDGRAHQTQVETGAKTRDVVQITKGLLAGQIVVTTGAYGLPDNTQVKTMPTGQSAATAPAAVKD